MPPRAASFYCHIAAALTVAAAAAADLPPSPFPPASADGVVVRSRLLEPLLPATVAKAAAAANTAKALQSKLLSNGSWPDVPYANQDRGNWLATAHLARARSMAVAVRSPLSPLVNSSSLLSSVNAALGYWLEHNFRNPNWYWNEIGVPQLLCDTLLLLEGRGLGSSDVQLALSSVGQAQMSTCDGSCGGANVADMSTITLQLGLVTGNESLAQSALSRLYANLAVFPQAGEGLQTDFSFHQVRPQPIRCTSDSAPISSAF